MGLLSGLSDPIPAPPAFGAGKSLPEESASWISRLAFRWLNPFLAVGFTRPLEVEDLWEVPEHHSTAQITTVLETNFYSRCAPEKRPRHMQPDSGDNRLTEELNRSNERLDATGDLKNEQSKYDESLFLALHRTFFARIWTAGAMRLVGDTLKTTTPLLNKVILAWLSESFTYAHASESQRASMTKPRGIGFGIGLAIALFVMQETASLLTNQHMERALATGILFRTGLIGAIVRKSTRLSGRARIQHNVGQITTMISADATRLDNFSLFSYNLWVAPLQIIIGVGLLIANLGASALVGLAVLILGIPMQFFFANLMFAQRKKGIALTDKRVQMTTEILQGIRLIKAYAWESFYAEQVGSFRKQEVETIHMVALARSSLLSMMAFVPVLASILSFIAYSLSGHDLNIAIIFSSLQLFNVIRPPLIYFPVVLSGLADTFVSLKRISTFLTAEDLPEPYPIDNSSPFAVEVEGDFAWETVLNPSPEASSKNSTPNVKSPGPDPAPKTSWWRRRRQGEPATGTVLPISTEDSEVEAAQEKPFELHNIRMAIRKGAFVGIVGRVGTGKSSILQALISEMRNTKGYVRFGGKACYAAQVPWIRNASLRENILFGRENDDERFQNVIRACSLEHDLALLPEGDSTEIGEKGINLSGGQKARVSLARAAYSDPDIVLLDDPLSAVDAYVGKSILDNCILSGPLANRTRIFVTHSLHVLDKTDYIYVMDHGSIVEEGTYADLMAKQNIFAKLIEEYGKTEPKQEAASPEVSISVAGKTLDPRRDEKTPQKLMQDEERNTGAVSWSTYKRFFGFAGGILWIPFIGLILFLSQVAHVGNSLALGFWVSQSIRGFNQGDYMALYAGLGVAQAVFAFALAFAVSLASLRAALNLFRTALNSVLRSPISFFDTTPIGRISSRLSKDQDTLDNQLALTAINLLNTSIAIVGTIALVFYVFPLLGIIFAPLAIMYYFVSLYYRRTSVEVKRLDSVLRSVLYGSLSETLTGLATIRAYREQERAVADADRGVNLQNRAYFVTNSIQWWLGVRLDLFSNVVLLGVALFAARFRNSVNPAKIGVVLSYTLATTQTFADMMMAFAQNEQNLNAVERILHYTDLPFEGEMTTAHDPPPTWPHRGEIFFKDVDLAYRPGLPLVLKGVTFHVKPGEKIGVVGRTGAGKTSLIQALLRIVEVQAGLIEVDGVDIRKIGLGTLRASLALVPQDSTLFFGTLRDNLDPQRLRTDAELISVLQRTGLLPRAASAPDLAAEAKFSLDSIVGDEGSNYSAGEKQLLALSRALVKNSRIIILDEATSSVDAETDAKVQKTIQTEFGSSTLLCIAHRLNTVAYYDRVLVMSDGHVAEFDKVLTLFDKEDSIFRSLCDEGNLKREEILRIRSGVKGAFF